MARKSNATLPTKDDRKERPTSAGHDKEIVEGASCPLGEIGLCTLSSGGLLAQQDIPLDDLEKSHKAGHITPDYPNPALQRTSRPTRCCA